MGIPYGKGGSSSLPLPSPLPGPPFGAQPPVQGPARTSALPVAPVEDVEHGGGGRDAQEQGGFLQAAQAVHGAASRHGRLRTGLTGSYRGYRGLPGAHRELPMRPGRAAPRTPGTLRPPPSHPHPHGGLGSGPAAAGPAPGAPAAEPPPPPRPRPPGGLTVPAGAGVTPRPRSDPGSARPGPERPRFGPGPGSGPVRSRCRRRHLPRPTAGPASSRSPPITSRLLPSQPITAQLRTALTQSPPAEQRPIPARLPTGGGGKQRE